jgi:hypothetical protein
VRWDHEACAHEISVGLGLSLRLRQEVMTMGHWRVLRAGNHRVSTARQRRGSRCLQSHGHAAAAKARIVYSGFLNALSFRTSQSTNLKSMEITIWNIPSNYNPFFINFVRFHLIIHMKSSSKSTAALSSTAPADRQHSVHETVSHVATPSACEQRESETQVLITPNAVHMTDLCWPSVS